MGGSDPGVAAIASSLADLGQMAAAIGERVLKLERWFVNECKIKEAPQS